MNELMSEYELEPRQATSMGDASASREWRRRLVALRTNESVNRFVKTCLLSLISCGPIPPLPERRHH